VKLAAQLGGTTSFGRGLRGTLRKLDLRTRPKLLVFDAAHEWIGRGRDPSGRVPAFRRSLDRSTEILATRCDLHLSAPFTADPGGQGTSAAVAATQIAFCDALRAEGAHFDGALGIGVGEIAAAYAAEALEIDDALAVAATTARAADGFDVGLTRIEIRAGAYEAKMLARSAVPGTRFAGAGGDGRSVLVVDASEKERAARYLEQHTEVVSSEPARDAWHTPRVRLSPQRIREELDALRPRRVRRALLMAAAGGVVRGDELDALYWAWALRHPFYADEAIAEAQALGFDLHPVGDLGTSIRALGRWTAAWRTRSVAATDSVASHDPARQGELGRAGPVHQTPTGEWIVVGHEEVRRALADPQTFSSRAWTPFDTSILSLDPPEHTAPRAVLRPVLAESAIASLGQFAADLADELVEAIREMDEFEVFEHLAEPLTDGVVGRLLGVEHRDIRAFAAALKQLATEGRMDIARDLVDELPEPPSLLARFGHSGMNESYSRALVGFLWVAGTITTPRTIAWAMLELTEQPQVRAELLEDISLLEPFVEEILRLHPAEAVVPRLTTRAVDLAGARISAGTVVQLSLAAANRDPARFPEPHALQLDRPARHLAFGAGPHRCPGARLARVEIIALLRTVLSAAPSFEATQPPATRRYWPTYGGSTLQELYLSFR
jgi:cytochrome P450